MYSPCPDGGVYQRYPALHRPVMAAKPMLSPALRGLCTARLTDRRAGGCDRARWRRVKAEAMDSRERTRDWLRAGLRPLRRRSVTECPRAAPPGIPRIRVSPTITNRSPTGNAPPPHNGPRNQYPPARYRFSFRGIAAGNPRESRTGVRFTRNRRRDMVHVWPGIPGNHGKRTEYSDSQPPEQITVPPLWGGTGPLELARSRKHRTP